MCRIPAWYKLPEVSEEPATSQENKGNGILWIVGNFVTDYVPKDRVLQSQSRQLTNHFRHVCTTVGTEPSLGLDRPICYRVGYFSDDMTKLLIVRDFVFRISAQWPGIANLFEVSCKFRQRMFKYATTATTLIYKIK